AGSLEALAEQGPDAFYGGDLGRAILRHLAETGGAITAADLAAYRVVRRRPVRAEFRRHEFVSNPPPSSGGVLIGYGPRLLDGAGNAASLSSSTGSGSGVIVPGTGIHLSNMLGEYDLLPRTQRVRPGLRLTSMMAPSIVLGRAGPRLVVGSAGSVRLRGAILQ